MDPAAPIKQALAKIKTKGVPLGYGGLPSPNLDHMKPTPASGEDSTRKADNSSDDQAPSPKPAKPVEYSKSYYRELYNLHRTCPALGRISIQDFNTAAWFNAATSDQDLNSMPRQFLEAAYFTIARQPRMPEKTQAIARLNLAIPDSPAFVAYIQQKRAEILERFATDERFKLEEQRWDTTSNEDKNAFLAYAGRTMLQILLPGREIEYPRYFVLRESSMSSLTRALFHPFYNEIYVNGSTAALNSFSSMIGRVVHEVTHNFQNIIAGWYENEALPPETQLMRQAKLYFVSNIENGSGIPADEHYRGYRSGFDERLPWALQQGLLPDRSEHVETDMFFHRDGSYQRKYTDPPVYKSNSAEGTLPKACLE